MSTQAEILAQKYGNRAEIGVDGDHAFALLGPDLQEGEAEFVKIHNPGDRHEERARTFQALNRLRDRLSLPNLTYALHWSHPNYCG